VVLCVILYINTTLIILGYILIVVDLLGSVVCWIELMVQLVIVDWVSAVC